ncbi:MAG: DUF4013 domain-containing protein [Thermacetogeniaceae bacterium]
MDVGKVLSFPFEDKDWIVKILIGGVLLLIPVVNFIVFGYIFRVLQKAAQDGIYEFPAWDDWGGLFSQGFFVFLMGLVYFLVPGILYGIGGALFGGSFLVASRFAYGFAPLAGLGILFMVLGGIIGFLIALIAPMALTLFAATGDFGQIFNFSGIFSRISSNLSNYALVILVYLGLAIVLGIVRKIPLLGFIIDLFASFYVMLVISYLLGTVFRGNSAASPPVDPPM